MCVFACSTVFSVNSQLAHAQTNTEVYVQDLTLDKTSYTSGETVTGSFVLANAHPATSAPSSRSPTKFARVSCHLPAH